MSDPTPAADLDESGTLLEIVDTLEELVGGARRVPFTPSVVVNEEEILELVDRIRVALPDDLVAARHTLEEREELLERAARDAAELAARAEAEATRLVGEAQARAAQLVDQHAVTRAATEQARVLGEEAERQAAAQRTAADEYARDVMARLAEQLDRWLGTVREGLDALPAAAPAGKRGRKR